MPSLELLIEGPRSRPCDLRSRIDGWEDSTSFEVNVEKRVVEDNPRAELVCFWGNTMACFQAELSISSGPSAIALRNFTISTRFRRTMFRAA
jgi:hypothetical protein